MGIKDMWIVASSDPYALDIKSGEKYYNIQNRMQQVFSSRDFTERTCTLLSISILRAF